MSALHRYAAVRVGAFAFLLFTGSSLAQTIDIATGGGNSKALLIDTADRPVKAMRALIANRYPSSLTGGNNPFFVNLRLRLQKATVARIEYTYPLGDGSATRVYHAVSGYPNDTIFQRAATSNKANSGTDSTGFTSTEEGAGEDAIDLARADEAEAAYYAPDTATDIRVTYPRNDDTSALQSYAADGLPRGADAEFKAFRKIEDDIRRGIVPRGGTVTGYVSKAVCGSCESVIESFAATYQANGTVYQLLEGPKSVPPTTPRPIVESYETSNELLGLRKQTLKDLLRKREAASEATPIETVRDVEAQEAALLRDRVDGC